MSVNRRSSRLASKKRIDYNEENLSNIDMNLDQIENPSSEPLKVNQVENPSSEPLKVNQVEIPSAEQLKVNFENFVQFAKDALVNNNKFQSQDSESTVNLDCTPQYTLSNSKEKDHGQTIVNGVNAPGGFRRRTKVNKIKFQLASETLLELKSTIASVKSAVYSFETCLKSKNKSPSDQLFNDRDNNAMDIDEIYVIDNERNDDNSNSAMEYNDDDSNNLGVLLDATQKEGSEHSDLAVNKPQQELINQEQFDRSEQVQDLMDVNQEPLDAQNPSVQDNDEYPIKKFKQPTILPRFTLKLSDDLKKAFQSDLPISTSLEDTEIIVYDSADPDFDKDDSIITVVEYKQNMTTTRKIRTTNEGLLSSESKKNGSINSSFVQTNDQIIKDNVSTTKRTTKKQDTPNSKIEDENSKKQVAKEQNTLDNHEKQDNTKMSFTSRDEHNVQGAQCVTIDEHVVYKNSEDSTSKKVPAVGTTTSQRNNSSTAKKDYDISNKLKVQKSQGKKKVPIEQECQSTNTSSVIKRVGVDEPKARENKSNTSLIRKKVDTVSTGSQIFKGKSATAVAKKVGKESSSVSNVQKFQVNSISNPPVSFETTKDQNSQRSDLTSVKDINETIKKNPSANASQSNKKMLNQKIKSTVKENPKNAKKNKVVEITIESTSSPLIPNSSVDEVVPPKRPASDDSTTSGDILGPILEMLDGNRKRLLKDCEVKIDETSPIPKQSMAVTNVPNLTDVPSNFRVETINLPYSSMSAVEHREFLQIESMMYYNPQLVIKEQYDFYQNMLERVMNERKNFEQWQFERSKLFLGHLNQLIESKVMNHLEYGRHSDINNYSVVELTIGLNPAVLEEPELKFKQKLGSIGRLFEFSIPSIANQIPIPLEKELWIDDIHSINTISADSKNIAMKNYWQKTKTPVVSRDPLIPTMLSNHKVDIVISSGSLAALVGLAESTEVELEIPIKIVEITKENSVLKTIYINKPFVKNQMTPREINQIYYNTAFESMTLKMNKINVSKVDNIKFENKDVELQHSSNNLEYSLWSIGDISILIRCKSSGYSGESGQKDRIVGIKTKLDYQLDYNYESITNVERARWWIYSLIRDKADLMLGRINVPMNTLCTIEKVSTEQILSDETRVKLFSKRLHYIFKLLQCSLSQGSYIFRHEKGEPYATVYKSIETAEVNSRETASRCIKIDRETIPFVPLVWKGIQAQITGTFPIRADPIRTNPVRNHGKYARKMGHFAHVPREKSIETIKPKKRKRSNNNNGGCDDLQYIADHVIESEIKIYDFDNVDESSGSSAPDFTTLLNNFNKKINNK